MRRAGIVPATMLALTGAGAVVRPAEAAMPATRGRIDTLWNATRAIVVYSWSWRTRGWRSTPTSERGRGPVPARPGTDAGGTRIAMCPTAWLNSR